MPECVSFRLYILLNTWEKFRTHLEVKYSRKETHTDY